MLRKRNKPDKNKCGMSPSPCTSKLAYSNTYLFMEGYIDGKTIKKKKKKKHKTQKKQITFRQGSESRRSIKEIGTNHLFFKAGP